MQTGGTSAAASPFCRLASRNSAAGEKTDGAVGDLFSRRGAGPPFFSSVIRCILTACRDSRSSIVPQKNINAWYFLVFSKERKCRPPDGGRHYGLTPRWCSIKSAYGPV